MKSGRSGALKPGKLGIGHKADKCSEALLPSHDTSMVLVMQAQPAPGDHRFKNKVSLI